MIDLFSLELISDIDNVPKQTIISPELTIKTHYESLDIAKSNTIFYLCFSLPEEITDADDRLDHILKKKENEE